MADGFWWLVQYKRRCVAGEQGGKNVETTKSFSDTILTQIECEKEDKLQVIDGKNQKRKQNFK